MAAAIGAVLDPQPVAVMWPGVVVGVFAAGGDVEPDVTDFPGWVGGFGLGGGGCGRFVGWWWRRRCFCSKGDFGLDRDFSVRVRGGSDFGVEGGLAGHGFVWGWRWLRMKMLRMCGR